jgi:hypothetical protein
VYVISKQLRIGGMIGVIVCPGEFIVVTAQ